MGNVIEEQVAVGDERVLMIDCVEGIHEFRSADDLVPVAYLSPFVWVQTTDNMNANIRFRPNAAPKKGDLLVVRCVRAMGDGWFPVWEEVEDGE